MNLLRLPPDAPDAVRRERKRLLVLIALGTIGAAVAAARFIITLKDPFAGVGLRATEVQRRVTAPASALPAPAPSEIPEAAAPARELSLQPSARDLHRVQEGPALVAPPRTEVFVQLAAFRDRARALSLSRRATRAGLPSSVMHSLMADGTTVDRVRIDQELNEQSARELVVALKSRLLELRPILVACETKG